MKQQPTRRIDSNVHSIGEVLRRPIFYKVPVYQRDFAWTNEEIDILWEDITSAVLSGRNEYFLGAIVVSLHIPVKSHTESGACRTARGRKSAVAGIVP